MALTKPVLSYPFSFAGNETLSIDYDSGSPDVVTLNLGTGLWYAQGDGAADDFVQQFADDLNTNASGYAFTVTLHGTYPGKIRIEQSGARTIDSFTFATGSTVPRELGLLVSTGLVVGDLSADYTALYQCRSLWLPHSEDHMGRSTDMDAVVSQEIGSGDGDDDVYQGPRVWEHVLPEVYGVLMRQQYASVAAYYGKVTGLSSGDTHAALDRWIRSYQGLLGGAKPVCRWTPDYAAPSTYREVYVPGKLAAGIKGWEESENLTPDFSNLKFELKEKL